MSIPIHPTKTGIVDVSSFDLGVYKTLGAIQDHSDPKDPCFKVFVEGLDAYVKVFWGQPESIFVKKIFPFITINRDDFIPNRERWMGVGQLEYRAGVSGTQGVVSGVSGFFSYEKKQQAEPYDFTYTISCWHRYERLLLPILTLLLKRFPSVGKIFVTDSLGLDRTYTSYMEGSVSPLHEIVDPTLRVRGYALTVRVEGELDLATIPDASTVVTGFDLNFYEDIGLTVPRK